MTPVIQVTGLTKRYGGQPVVDGISFDVERGEIFGLLGPNGAGKTTTVECLEGLRRRDAGQVRILGLDPQADGHRLHQRIGVQLQETQLQDKLTVAEALRLYASLYPDPADWRELLNRWGLAGQRGASFRKLSGGQKQRLFIALALVGNPEVVFLDELTSGLDPGARRATWDLIGQVRDSGVTVVLVSHFMDEVEELCDRVAILEQGRIAALDTPAGLVDAAGGEYRMRFRPYRGGTGGAVAGRAAWCDRGQPPRRAHHRDRDRGFRLGGHRGPGPQADPRRGPADRRTQPGQRLRRADRPEHGHVREVLTMNGFSRLTAVEARLFLRERAGLLAVFGLPVALVIGFGLIPGFSDPQKTLSGQSGTEYIASLGVAIVLAILGLTGVPMVIGQYRERGVLRRLAVTPVRPLALLLADLTVWAAAAVASVALVVAVVRIAFHVPAPVKAGWFILVRAARHRGAVRGGPARGGRRADRQDRGRPRVPAVLPQHVPGRRLLPDRGDVTRDAPDRQFHAARRSPARGAGQLDGN